MNVSINCLSYAQTVIIIVFFLYVFRSYFFGSNDVMTNVPLYNEIVKKIIDDTNTDELQLMPCFINTMGFVEGKI